MHRILFFFSRRGASLYVDSNLNNNVVYYYDDNQVPFSPTRRHFADPARVNMWKEAEKQIERKIKFAFPYRVPYYKYMFTSKIRR